MVLGQSGEGLPYGYYPRSAYARTGRTSHPSCDLEPKSGCTSNCGASLVPGQ